MERYVWLQIRAFGGTEAWSWEDCEWLFTCLHDYEKGNKRKWDASSANMLVVLASDHGEAKKMIKDEKDLNVTWNKKKYSSTINKIKLACVCFANVDRISKIPRKRHVSFVCCASEFKKLTIQNDKTNKFSVRLVNFNNVFRDELNVKTTLTSFT